MWRSPVAINHDLANADPGPYVNYTAPIGYMVPGGVYPFTFTHAVNWNFTQYLVWIDWNGRNELRRCR